MPVLNPRLTQLIRCFRQSWSWSPLPQFFHKKNLRSNPVFTRSLRSKNAHLVNLFCAFLVILFSSCSNQGCSQPHRQTFIVKSSSESTMDRPTVLVVFPEPMGFHIFLILFVCLPQGKSSLFEALLGSKVVRPHLGICLLHQRRPGAGKQLLFLYRLLQSPWQGCSQHPDYEGAKKRLDEEAK